MAKQRTDLSGLPDWQMEQENHLTQQCLVTQPIVLIPANSFHAEVTSTNLVSMANGTPVFAEISTFGIGGFLLDADNEAVSTIYRLPDDLNVEEAIEFRALWSSTGTSGSAQFTVRYSKLAIDDVLITLGTVTAGTALDTVIADDTVSATANYLQASPWGTLAAGTLDDDERYLELLVGVDLTTLSDCTFLGLEMRYVRHKL